MSVASREARESNWWLLLLKKSQLVAVDLNDEIESCDELIKLLTSIVKTSQNSLKKNKH
jgi:four helix bundle protein